MSLDWTKFVEIVHRHQRFLFTTHIRPDGDGLGSMLALEEVLRRQGKEVQMVITSTFPPRYRFLDPEARIQQFSPPGENYRQTEVVLVLDTGTDNQLAAFGPFLRSLPAVKVVIDHHRTQDELGALRLVDTTAEATGRLVFEAITALGAPLPATAASALFVALAMDTGWFRHSNATAATFALAEKLVAAGARPELLYDRLFEENSLARLKLTGLVLERLQVTAGGQVAYTEIRRRDYETTGATPQDSEDLVNYTRSLTGVEVGLLFMEQPRGGVKVSFRSRARVDVSRLAEQFGGGGHRLASGAVLEAPLEEARARILQAVELALDAARPTR
ncbi:MAG TPA: bifunctional oligoribonuclease/PAP phosphatase NrnA [Gemmataceae bacterium]|nr:bifunctional oligoribonuclease/PAP phosphatase NrnA [Gemmataceae bacterium]